MHVDYFDGIFENHRISICETHENVKQRLKIITVIFVTIQRAQWSIDVDILI